MKTIVKTDGKTRYSVRCIKCKTRFITTLADRYEIDGQVCTCGAILSNGTHHPKNNIWMADMRPIEHVKRLEPTKCDSRCTHSKGFTCDCQCGGFNHGKN